MVKKFKLCLTSLLKDPKGITSSEDIIATVTSGCELGIVAGSAVNPVGLRPELLVDEGRAALGADEAGLVPVLLLVRQILKKVIQVFTIQSYEAL
jgi:hypothetical protein